MTRALVMIPALAACFFAAVLNLAADSRFRRILMRAAAIGAVAIGAVLYGYGYAYCMGLGFTSFIRALLALCRMFGGVNDLASVQDAPLFRIPAVQAVFWLGHFLAFYLTASAEARARRRQREEVEKGIANQTADAVKASLLARDKIDSTRKYAPLMKADGVVEIDSSDMTLDEVVETVLAALPPVWRE